MNIQDKNIILTGASAGIGLEMLNILSSYRGVRIVAVARNIDTIPILCNTIFPFAADLSTDMGVDEVFNYAKSIFGEVDIFISNAGIAYLGELGTADWKHMSYIYHLNVFSPIYSLERFAETINKQKVFVALVSAVTMFPLPYYSLYCSTKSALHQFFEAYQYEKNQNLKIMTVYPVATKTDFFDKAAKRKQAPIPFISQHPEFVAKQIIKGIEKDRIRVYPCLPLKLFYPIIRIFPFLVKLYSLNEKRKVKKWMDRS